MQKRKLLYGRWWAPFLFYERAIDSTMLTPLSAIASAQAEPNEQMLDRVKQCLDYAASDSDAVLTYSTSDMVLAAHSDAAYHTICPRTPVACNQQLTGKYGTPKIK